MAGWEIRGVRGPDPDPPLLSDKFSGRLVILGSGRCLWDDLENLGDFGGDVMGINFSGLFYPGRLDHWASLHPNIIFEHAIPLKQLFTPQNRSTHIYRHRPSWVQGPADCVWDIDDARTGSSGLFAVLISLVMGYEKIVLAGIPMDGSGHFYGPSGGHGVGMQHHTMLKYWGPHLENIRKSNRVRSMSGKTRGWFGEPTKEWIDGN
jgi:hypothetical protein